MSHYELLGHPTERLMSQLYATSMEFYSIKQEYLQKRDAFLHVLAESKGVDWGSIKQEETPTIETSAHVVMKMDELEGGCQEGTKSSPLFHRIALATHPDKHPECNPIYFQQAQKANEQGKFAKLLFLSRYLGLETPKQLTEEEIQKIQCAIEKKKGKIQHYQKTYPWLYAKAETEELRKKLVEAFCKVNAS